MRCDCCHVLRLDPRDDLVVRPATVADAATLGRVRVETWRDAYAGILPDAELRRLDPRRSAQRLRHAMGTRRGQVLLAVQEPGEAAFGYAWAGPQPDREFGFRGEIYELYLQPRYQQRGAGRRLLSATLWHLAEHALWPALVWSLAKNPARHFYEACGGRQVLAGTVEVAGHVLPRVGFAWDGFLPLPGLGAR